MNQTTTSKTALIVSSAPQAGLESPRRLLVLVPAVDADFVPLAQRVWQLAKTTGVQVRFLGLCNDPEQEPALRRSLATMSAMLNSETVRAQSELIHGRDWVEAVRSRWQPGDVVVCSSNPGEGVLRRPLSQILPSDLDVPLYILSGLYPKSEPRPKRLARAAAWIGSIVLIAGFFLLQAEIGRVAGSWTIPLQLLSLPVEFGSIWAWNSLLG